MTFFDPYHAWLQIPPEQQPPDHYRMLSLARFDGRPEAVAAAVRQRLASLHPHLTGPQGDAARRIEREIEHARQWLLDDRRRAAYDAMLRAVSDTAESSAPPPAVANAPVRGLSPAAAPPAPSRSLQTDARPGASDRNIGKRIGPYLLLERIGEATAGAVYKAQQTESGAIVALKLLKPAAGQPELLKRFEREFQVTRRLSHVNLIVGFEMGEAAGVHYLAMEYTGGTDLEELVRRHGPLPTELAVDYLRAAAEGLAYLHEHGIYHRNVKPQNLLLNLRGQIKISSLLLAKLDDDALLAELGGEALTRQGSALGSVDYLAPEQAADASSIDARADIYSLGCTLHFLLLGKPPYGGKGVMDRVMAHSSSPIPSLRAARPDVPIWLDKLFRRMLAKQPSGRPASMNEVVQRLERGDELTRGQVWMIAVAIAMIATTLLALLLALMSPAR